MSRTHHAPRLPLAAMGLAALAILAGRIPHALANSPPCVYQISSDQSTATDTITSLSWQRAAPSTAFTWSQAKAHCSALVLNGNGPGTWRLPTIHEIQTIVDEGQTSPAIDATTFTDMGTGFFWSSTPVAASTGNYWGVYFAMGNVGTADESSLHAVRCVH